MAEIEKIERYLELLPDSRAVYDEWKRLVIAHRILGTNVHDAKLVAVMRVHSLGKILTLNVGDFARYDIEAIHPAALF